MATQNPDIAIESVTILRNEVPSPTGQDGKVLSVQAGELAWVDPAVDANDKVRASSADTTPDYLGSKLVAGDNVSLSVQDPGGNEKIKVDVSVPPATDEKTKVSATDTTPDYLGSKLLEGANISLTVEGSGGDEKIRVAATGGSSTDELVKTSAADSTPMYLGSKLSPGAGIGIDEEFDDGVGFMRISATFPPDLDEKVKISASDSNPDFLQNKIVPGPGIGMATEGGVGEEQLIRISTIVDQSELILAVDILGSDTPTEDRPAKLYGGDYSAYPFLTIQAAIDSVGLVRGPKTTIKVGAGSWDPFRLAGVTSDREFTIQGTMGAPIGPFEVTDVLESGWKFEVAGATWVPSTYAGCVFEIISGPGAGSSGMIYTNGTDSIDVSGYAMDNLAVGSVFQIVPFVTNVLGIADPYSLVVNMIGLTGRFVLRDLDITGNPLQIVNLQCALSQGAQIAFSQVRLSGSDQGFVIGSIGTLIFGKVWFNGNNCGGSIAHVQSFSMGETLWDEDIFSLFYYDWHSVGGFNQLLIEECDDLFISFSRFTSIDVDDTRHVEIDTVKLESGGGLRINGCSNAKIENIFGTQDGASISILRTGIFQMDDYITDHPLTSIGLVLVPQAYFQQARLKNLSLVMCRDVVLSNVQFPEIDGSITIDQGYLQGNMKYNTSGNIFDGTSFHPFSDFNPGPTSKYVTAKTITITLESEALP